MATVPPRYRENKLTELILYVADRCAIDEYYGVLKLNKILFYSDFTAFKSTGAPITGAVYRKYEHGPAPEGMKPLKQRMINNNVAFEWHQFLPGPNGGATEKRLFAKQKPKMDVFTPEEIAIVDRVIEWLRPMTGAEVSLMSHKHPGWALAADEDVIPYVSALLPEGASRSLAGKDLAWARSVASKYQAGAPEYQLPSE